MSLTEELLVSFALRISASAAGGGAVKALEVKSGYISSQTDILYFICLFVCIQDENRWIILQKVFILEDTIQAFLLENQMFFKSLPKRK